MNNFLFLGGDMRLVYAAEELNKCFDCFIYGQEKLELSQVLKTPVLREITKCRNLVLGLPASRDGKTLNAPNSVKDILPELIIEAVEPGGTVFCGKTFPLLEQICGEHGFNMVDYFEREELAVMNTIPTAEGALEILMRESDITIYGANILVTGFGRISKVLAKYLAALGAKVTVAARKYSDLSWARIMGCNSIHISKISQQLPLCDAVINTVPAEIFTDKEIDEMKRDLLFVDLASTAAVSNKNLAVQRGVKYIWALSLPGKAAPVTSGKIIADTIINIISEKSENGG